MKITELDRRISPPRPTSARPAPRAWPDRRLPCRGRPRLRCAHARRRPTNRAPSAADRSHCRRLHAPMLLLSLELLRQLTMPTSPGRLLQPEPASGHPPDAPCSATRGLHSVQ